MHLETQAHREQSPFLEHSDASASSRLRGQHGHVESSRSLTRIFCRLEAPVTTRKPALYAFHFHFRALYMWESIPAKKTWTSHNKSAFALWCFVQLVGHNNRFSARFVQRNKRNNYSVHIRPRVLQQVAFYQPALKNTVLYNVIHSPEYSLYLKGRTRILKTFTWYCI